MTERKEVQRLGAYVLLVEEERLLLCRLRPGGPYGGLWTLPGGGVEFGEHPEEAAVRELDEETGLEVALDGLVSVTQMIAEYPDLRVHHVQMVYRGHVLGGTARAETDGTTDGCEWLTLDEVRERPLGSLAAHGVALAFGGEEVAISKGRSPGS